MCNDCTENINELDFPRNQDGSIDIEKSGIPGFLAHLERAYNEAVADMPYLKSLIIEIGEKY
jgi:hypothetical protein